jgi:hypothetical protein
VAGASTLRLTQGEGEGGTGAAGTSIVVIGELIGLSAVDIAGGAGGRGAAGVIDGDAEAGGNEGRIGGEIDGGEIPEESLAGLGVLKLEDGGEVGGGGDLDGDATAVGVDAPGLDVGGAGLDGLHVAAGVGDGPEIDILAHVVDDLDAAAGGAGSEREGRSSEGEGSSEAEELGERHDDCGVGGSDICCCEGVTTV